MIKGFLALISFISFCFLLIGIIVIVNNTYYHEDAHKQYAIYNHCSEYEIEYYFNPHFQCLNRSKVLTPEEKHTEYMLDSMNEIVSYNMTTVWLSVLLVGFVMCLIVAFIYFDYKMFIINKKP